MTAVPVRGIHVYDENGDEILTYTVGVGWHEKESRAETEVHGDLAIPFFTFQISSISFRK